MSDSVWVGPGKPPYACFDFTAPRNGLRTLCRAVRGYGPLSVYGRTYKRIDQFVRMLPDWQQRQLIRTATIKKGRHARKRDYR